MVPINALSQRRPAPERKGRTIAVANLLSFIGVALQPVAQFAMIRLGHPNPARVFLIAAAVTVVMGLVLNEGMCFVVDRCFCVGDCWSCVEGSWLLFVLCLSLMGDRRLVVVDRL
mgnify:CR=1 FL=1